MKLADITMIIPCYNEAQVIATCLDSVIAQRQYLGELGKIIVAVNGSTDETFSIASDYAKQHKYIRAIDLQTPNKKSAENAALKIAQTRYVLFLDADSFLDNDALRQLQEMLTKDTYAIVGAIRRPILRHDRINKSFLETYYMLHYAKRLSLPERESIQGWFMALDRDKLGYDFTFPDDFAIDDIWLSAYTWTLFGPQSIGYIDHAIGSYIPPTNQADMNKQVLRHRSAHKVVQDLHPNLLPYFQKRNNYYHGVDVHAAWRMQAIRLGVDFDKWIDPYIIYIKQIDAKIAHNDHRRVVYRNSWSRVASSKRISIKQFHTFSERHGEEPELVG